MTGASPAGTAGQTNRAGGPTLDVLVVTGLSLVVECGLSLLLWRRSDVWLLLLAGHLSVTVLAAGWAWTVRDRSRYTWLLVIGTATFGPLGPAGVLLTTVVERVRRQQAASIDEWHRALFPPTGVDEHARLWRRVGQRASDRPAQQPVTPFLDILAFGSVPQKQAVVSIIAQQFRPAFAPALRAALRDEHNVVRVQAATAIARLEQEHLETTVALEAAVERAPNDASALLALATHHDDLAFGGLLDAVRAGTSRDKAARGYERYLLVRPDDLDVEQRLARLLLRRKDFAAAEPRFRRLFEHGHPGAQLWLMECLFAQRKFAELRAVAALEGELAPESASLEAIVTLELWAHTSDALGAPV